MFCADWVGSTFVCTVCIIPAPHLPGKSDVMTILLLNQNAESFYENLGGQRGVIHLKS